MALLADGSIVQWGKGMRLYPVPAKAKNIVAISAGSDHALALRNDGKVLTWDANRYGQLDIPTDIGTVVAISAGLQYSLVLTSKAKVIGWGTNTYGQLKVPANLTDVVGIAAGHANSAVALNSGREVTFGANAFGALASRTPTKSARSALGRLESTLTPSALRTP